MAEIRVRDLAVMFEATWSFDDGRPTWRNHAHGGAAVFDPFPGYPHDRAVVDEMVERVAGVLPPLWDVDVVVADREVIGRTNGFSSLRSDGEYVGDVWTPLPPQGLIMLSGKRIPPHPAMTRYLVGHEYGHNVEWMLEYARGGQGRLQRGEVAAEYARLRGLGEPHWGSGGRWHDSVTEIFACDFRIIVCRVEPDYWPHPGIAHPYDNHLLPNDLHGWWAAAEEQLRAAPAPAAAAAAAVEVSGG